MTSEGTLHVTGFSQVGEGKTLRAYGHLFGFPVEATAPRNGQLNLSFTVEAVKPKHIRRARRILRKDEELRRKVKILPVNEGDSGALVAGGVLGGAIGGVIAGAAASASAGKKAGAALTVTIRLDDELQAKRLFEAATARLKEVFREVEITAPKGCPICELPRGEMLTKYGGRLHLLHQNCLHNWKNETVAQMETKRYNAGHLRGVVGGLIGGIVGSLPALIALFIFDLFIGVLFAFIPMGVYFGWKLFGGLLSRGTTVFTILYSLLLAPVIVGAYWFLVFRILHPEPGLSWWDILEGYFTDATFLSYFLGDTFFAFLATIFGIFIAWRLISKTDQQELDRVKAAFDDAVPLERPDNRF